MRISTKGHYAVEALVYIATKGGSLPVSLSEISSYKQTSLYYLEQLFLKLRKAKIVKSVRGPGGGYLLNKKASDISIVSIFDAVKESIELTDCATTSQDEKVTCARFDLCKTQPLWSFLFEHVRELLSFVTLQNIIDDDLIFDDIRDMVKDSLTVKASVAGEKKSV